MKKCNVEGCERPFLAKGICRLHYGRIRAVTHKDEIREHGRKNDERRRKDPKRQEYMKQYLQNYAETERGKEVITKIKRRYQRKRYRAILRATPPWANISEIKKIYKECPEGSVVDHIIPLLGKNICGLNVPCNMQYLTYEENARKGNRVAA